jgi:hypothetical protein
MAVDGSRKSFGCPSFVSRPLLADMFYNYSSHFPPINTATRLEKGFWRSGSAPALQQ